MVNILLCGNERVFDGALTQLISMTNRTQETIRCYIFTMDLTRMKPEYKSISDSQVKFLEKVIKENEELIKHDTLAVDIKYNETRESYIETNINGEKLNIDVEVD